MEDDEFAHERVRLAAVKSVDFAEARPTFERIARLAQRMARVQHAHIAIVGARGVDFAANNEHVPSQDSRAAIFARATSAQNQTAWIEDLPAVEEAVGARLTTGQFHMRFYAAAPIRLPGGEQIGVLALAHKTPRPFNKRIADNLAEYAAFAADEWGRQQTLQALANTEQRLNLALQIADINVWEMDWSRRKVSSAGAEPVTRTSAADAEGAFQELDSDMSRSVHPHDRQAVAEAWDRHVTEGVPYRVVHRQMRHDGPHVWVASGLQAFKDERGRVVRLLGVTRNIDKEKRTEIALAKAKDEAEAANQAKTAFLASMSHEIRTPLNGVLGMAQAMAADTLSPVQRDRLEVVRQSGQSLLAILNDVLDLAKIEAGKMDLEEIEFDLAEVARGAYAAFTEIANRKGLSFALNVDAAQGLYRGDPTRLRQIIYNLVSNALKFTERGEIRVNAWREGGELCVAVKDTGVGIPADRIEHLFNQFTQEDVSTTRRFGGTGLGLAICRQLAGLMGGDISVESVVGAGSVFTLRAPLVHVGDARPTSHSLASNTGSATQTVEPLHIRVLAAEDNAVNQLVLKTLLHQVGIEPTVVDNGRLAVEAWEQGGWDLILMDVQMPEMDGTTAARAIRAREAETGRARTPIIALTANVMSQQVAEYLEAGMDAYVGKPIVASTLYQAIEMALCGEEDGAAPRESAAAVG